MNHKYVIIYIALIAVLSACAHPITIAPNLNAIDRKDAKQSDKNAGFYISPADKSKEVTTEGGGGDKIRYQPYKDIEPALYKVLINVFKNAYRMPSANDTQFIKDKNISFVFIPVIDTQSSSSGVLTWMATDFTVKLDVKAFDENGKQIWGSIINADGHADFNELMKDFQLSSRRASEKAFLQLQSEISASPEFYK